MDFRATLRPGFCCFGVVDECFLRCKMCQKWRPDLNVPRDIPKPDITLWKRAISSLRSIAGRDFLINFGGGEALLLEGLLDIVHFAAENGLRTNIASNACLIDEPMARRIGRSGLSSINISLDSMNPSTHDYLRGVPGVYHKVMDAIEYLDKYCPGEFEIIICCVIYKINMDEVVSVAEWVNKHPRIKWVYFMAAMQPNNTRPNPRWYREEFQYLWPDDTARITTVIDRLIGMKKQGSKINNQFCQLEAFKQYFDSPDRFVKKTACNLDRAVHVDAIGNIYICYEWERIGNIMHDDLAMAWYSKKACAVRNNIINCKRNCHHLLNCFFEGDYPFQVI